MEELKKYAKENMIPIVRDKTAEVLVNLCKKIGPKHILEIGTAIGYSGILMLKSTDADLVTIEKNEQRALEAQTNFEKYGFKDNVDIKIGDAEEEVKKLSEQNRKFDLIFLDGPKGQYFRYYPYLKDMLTGGGTLFADNVDLLGLIENPQVVTHKNRAMFNNMNKFIDIVKNDKDMTTTFYHIDDGFCIIEKK